jgi:hypothetical protein
MGIGGSRSFFLAWINHNHNGQWIPGRNNFPWIRDQHSTGRTAIQIHRNF